MGASNDTAALAYLIALTAIVFTAMGVLGGLLFPLAGAIADIWLLVSLEKTALAPGAVWFVLGLCYLGWITRCFRQAPPEVAV